MVGNLACYSNIQSGTWLSGYYLIYIFIFVLRTIVSKKRAAVVKLFFDLKVIITSNQNQTFLMKKPIFHSVHFFLTVRVKLSVKDCNGFNSNLQIFKFFYNQLTDEPYLLKVEQFKKPFFIIVQMSFKCFQMFFKQFSNFF